MHSGGRGRSRLRLSERGLLQPPSPVKRRLFPRAQLLPFLLLALATLLAGYIIWSNWLRQTEDNLLRGPAPRVRPGGAGLGGVTSSHSLGVEEHLGNSGHRRLG